MRTVNFKTLEHGLTSFWRLQLTGWFCYLLFYYLHLVLFKNPKLMDLHRVGIIFLTGLGISCILHIIYKRINYQSRSLVTLAACVLGCSFFSAAFWFLISRYIAIATLYGHVGFVMFIKRAARQAIIGPIFFDTLFFCAWSALYFTIKLFNDWNMQKEKTEEATAKAQRAHLELLRYQLNPHFLFNALNSIRALITEDKKVAKELITELSEFLRYSLISKNDQKVAFGYEIEAIKHYIAIESKRYEDKLKVEFETDPAAEDFPVISYLLHPLVENAIKYGMQTSPLPLLMRINASVKKGRLLIDVSNTGKWVEQEEMTEIAETENESGLNNIKKRLESIYPDRHDFMIREKEGSVHVHIVIHK